MNFNRILGWSVCVVAILGLVSVAPAAIVQSNTTEAVVGGANHPIPVGAFWAPSATDLVNTGSSAYLSTVTDFVQETGGFLDFPDPALRNGTAVALDSDAVFDDSGFQLTFNLDLTTNTLGYDLTEIDSYAAGPPSGVNSRGDQSWSLSVEFANNIGTFVGLGNYSVSMGGDRGGSRIELTDDSGTIASGISAVRFDIDNVSSSKFEGSFSSGFTHKPESSGLVRRFAHEFPRFGKTTMLSLQSRLHVVLCRKRRIWNY